MKSFLAALLRRDSVRLAGILAVAATLALLDRDGAGAQAIGEANPERRAASPEISAPDLSGHRWRLSDERGAVVLVNFWASWCPPCRAETPALVRASNAYRDRGVRIVGVSLDDTIDPVRSFVERFQVPYTVVMPDGNDGPASRIESLPTSFLIDRHGRVAKTYLGALDDALLARDLDVLLREP